MEVLASGQNVYTETLNPYIIVCDGLVYGPFRDKDDADANLCHHIKGAVVQPLYLYVSDREYESDMNVLGKTVQGD